MGYDRKYGHIRTERGTIGADEPLFVIRARDACAPEALHAYAEAAIRYGADDALVAPVRERAEQIAAWQLANPDLVKIPDTTAGQIIDAPSAR